MQRYFIDVAPAANLTLPKDPAHHLVKVMRASLGAKLELVLADHHVYLAELIAVEPAVQVKVVEQLPADSELPVRVTLACGLPKTKEKPELIVQKATELGVDRIVFFESTRSISRWQDNKQERKLARLQKIAESAAEQSHRNLVPIIEYRQKLDQVLADYPATCRLVAWEESAKKGETSALAQQLSQLQPGDSVLAIFGPEGGLTNEEVATMTSQDVVAVGLGPRILRTETAPLYLMAAISYAIELS